MKKERRSTAATKGPTKDESLDQEQSQQILSRKDFERLVFERDGGTCIFCDKKAVDAHHIVERKLFPPDSGGYFLDNGASVCAHHHMQVEMTTISCGKVRRAAGIARAALPPGDHFDPGQVYDKWGNTIYVPDDVTGNDEEEDAESTYARRPGQMFHLANVQKSLKSGDRMWCFSLPVEGL